jgi:hypothetical protein
MLVKMGVAFYWLGNGLTALFLGFVIFKMFIRSDTANGALIPLCIFCALTSWIAGKAMLHMLSGDPMS